MQSAGNLLIMRSTIFIFRGTVHVKRASNGIEKRPSGTIMSDSIGSS